MIVKQGRSKRRSGQPGASRWTVCIGCADMWILVKKKVEIKSGDALITTEDFSIYKPNMKKYPSKQVT